MKPVQEFTIPQGRDVGEYHVMYVQPTMDFVVHSTTNLTPLNAYRPAKFPNVTSVTLFFPAAQGADTTRIYYVGFLGQWSEVSTYFRTLVPLPRSWLTSSARDQRKFEPVVTVYESKPNLADHDKIQGLNENWSAPGT